MLRAVARPIESREQIPVGLLEFMDHTIRRANGAGLAAPQVGASVRLIVVRGKTPKGTEVRAFLNPTIVQRSDDTFVHPEGCLSIPRFYTSIKRHHVVLVEYQALDLETHYINLAGHDAAVFQHEIHHLDGKLIVDHVSRQQRRHAERLVAKALAKPEARTA